MDSPLWASASSSAKWELTIPLLPGHWQLEQETKPKWSARGPSTWRAANKDSVYTDRWSPQTMRWGDQSVLETITEVHKEVKRWIRFEWIREACIPDKRKGAWKETTTILARRNEG